MPLDPRAKMFLQQIPVIDRATVLALPIEDRRRANDEMVKRWAGKQRPIAAVVDRSIPGTAGEIPIRIYRPEGKEPFPVLVRFHGGGFWMGSIDTEDAPCRSQAKDVGCIIVSVEYRLAPEHKFPVAVEDCYSATEWVAKNAGTLGGDPTRIAVGGGSAGGNLAAVVALMARDRGYPSLVGQILTYPVTNHAFDTVSYEQNAEGYLLTKEAMQDCWNLYLQTEQDGQNSYASPLRADNLSGLPSALVITAEYDPLRDEGEAYAVRLREAGVPVVYTCYEGMIHGGLPREMGQAAMEEANAFLRDVFGIVDSA